MEIDELVAELDRLRESVLKKLVGLSDDDLRRSTVPSGTNMGGLLQHLTFVESHWFADIVAGGTASLGARSMDVSPLVTLAMLRADYRAACAASNRIIESLGNADHSITRGGRRVTLRQAILAVIVETARHAGHADIVREQIDGRTGR